MTICHMVIEGMPALTGRHFIMDHNERQGTLPAFVGGFTRVARDEHRLLAFGARFLRGMVRRDPANVARIRRTLAEVAPAADAVLKPSWYPDEAGCEMFGVSASEVGAFAFTALERRPKVIGLLSAAA